MLIDSTERRHRRELELAAPGARWPARAFDIWWAQARSSREPERVALRLLDQWKRRATFELQGSLFVPSMNQFLELTGANRFSRVLDKVSVAPLAAYGVYRKLFGNYTGPAFNSARSSDSAAADYYFSGDTLAVDALVAHGAGTDELVGTLYDQTNNGLALTATTTQRPKIVSAGVAVTSNRNGALTILFDGSANRLGRADAMGLSGSPPFTVATAHEIKSVGGTSAVVFSLGGNATNAMWGALYNASDAANVYSWQNGSHREFGVTQGLSSRWVFQRAGSTTPSAYTASQETAALTQSGLLNGATALALVNTKTRIGCACTTADSLFCNMKLNLLVLFTSTNLQASDLDLLDREMWRHV